MKANPFHLAMFSLAATINYNPFLCLLLGSSGMDWVAYR